MTNEHMKAVSSLQGVQKRNINNRNAIYIESFAPFSVERAVSYCFRPKCQDGKLCNKIWLKCFANAQPNRCSIINFNCDLHIDCITIICVAGWKRHIKSADKQNRWRAINEVDFNDTLSLYLSIYVYKPAISMCRRLRTNNSHLYHTALFDIKTIFSAMISFVGDKMQHKIVLSAGRIHKTKQPKWFG